MLYKLERPLSVYNGEETVDCSDVVVSFTGRKGLKVLKRIQDTIYKSFAEQAKNANTQKAQDEKDDEILKVEDVYDMLEMTGNSEKIFDEVEGTLKAFATMENKKMTEAQLDEINTDDLDGLCRGVLEHFLLPKICQKMSNMKK